MLADIALRRRPYAEADLFTSSGRYGVVRWVPVGLMVAGGVHGFGLVVNTYASWLSWQGYLLGPFGLGGKRDLGVRQPRGGRRAAGRVRRVAHLRAGGGPAARDGAVSASVD